MLKPRFIPLLLAIFLALTVGLFLSHPALAAGPPLELTLAGSSQSKSNEALTLADLPLPLQYAASGAVGADQSAYHFTPAGAGFTAKTAGLETGFATGGITVQSGPARLSLSLASYGYRESLQPVQPARPTVQANRLEYRRGPLTEWYVNGPGGLQQGFTLTEPPPSSSFRLHPSSLTLALALSGGWQAEVAADGRNLTLTHPATGQALTYGGLYVYDAAGRELPARFEIVDFGTEILDLPDAGQSKIVNRQSSIVNRQSSIVNPKS